MKLKKFLSLLLSAAMAFSLLTAKAAALEQVTHLTDAVQNLKAA